MHSEYDYKSHSSSIDDVLERVESLPEFQMLSTRKQSEVDQKLFLVPTRSDDSKSRSKKFLFRLVQALHSSGSLSFRTEETVHLVARSFNMYAICAILPVSVSISFNTTAIMTPKHSETYTFKISSGMDLRKLDQLYYLCKELQELNIDLYAAENLLKKIETQPPQYHASVIAIAYAFTSGVGCMLFYGGGIEDAVIAAFLGFIVFLVGQLCLLTEGLPQIESFLSSFIVTVTAYFINTYLVQGSCNFAQLLGGITWLLPGASIVIALLEIYSQSIVYGSARLVYAISLASQLGFGMAIGCGLCYPLLNITEVFTTGCESPFPAVYKCVFVPVMGLAMAIIFGCSPSHYLGVAAVSGGGVLAATWTQQFLGPRPIAENVAGIVAAAVITTLARIFGQMAEQNYFIYLATGLLMLVPGGIGVRGMSDMWSGDMQGGIVFTFKMCLVGVSLAMGVFLALIPRGIWLHMYKQQSKNIPVGESNRKMKIYRDPSYASFQSEGYYYHDIPDED